MDHTAECLPEFGFRRDPEAPFDPPPERMRWLEQEGLPRVRLWNGGTAWVISGYEEQRLLLADPRISADDRHPNYPFFSSGSQAVGRTRTFLRMDGAEHSEHRRRFLPGFSARRMRALVPRIEEITSAALDAMEKTGPPCDLMTAFALPVPSRVICELLGVAYADHEFFERDCVELTDINSSAEVVCAAWRRILEYLAALADAKAEDPADDLMSVLAQEMAAGRISREQCASDALLILLGGHETTANMIALGSCLLLQHPGQLVRVRDGEPQDVARAVDELMRFLSVAQSGRRRVATADIEVAGGVIRAGDGVIFAGDVANRDPRVFEEPGRLDVGRQARYHLGFGHGPHRCPGESLARLELQVAIPALLRRFPGLRLDRPLGELRFRSDSMNYGVQEMPVSW
ncbi:cytochrome P450 [Streptomyces blastmyceticus]|uniref:Cytochrome P450 n=1 Tax=Streptomyces blastmyceticus TaxID=68180 RepID=A0ABP3GJU8_9ACTN